MSERGFSEIEHTADWALQVWGADLEALMQSAADGMLHLLNAQPKDEKGEWRSIDIRADDAEGLLVGWLEELLFLLETENVTFTAFQFERVSSQRLRVKTKTVPSQRPSKQIKAVTYHNLVIRQQDGLFQTEIVFDV